MKLLPPSFFTPKDPTRFEPPAQPVSDLLMHQPIVTTTTATTKKPAGKRGRPRTKGKEKSYRRTDLEIRLAVAQALGSPVGTINALAEYMSGPHTPTTFRRHLYEYVDGGTGLGKKQIEAINQTVRELGGAFSSDYDIAKVPLHRDYAKEWEENEAPYYRRVFLHRMMRIADTVIRLDELIPEQSTVAELTSPFPNRRCGWDLEEQDAQMQLLRAFAPALREGVPRGSLDFWVWQLAYERLVLKKKSEAGYMEMLDAHDSIRQALLERVAPEISISRLQIVLGAGATC